jgi:ankyrin repeat protein
MEKIVLLLLERGADVNAHGGQYGYALHVALAEKNEKTAQLLIKNGANMNLQVSHIVKRLTLVTLAHRVIMAQH